MKKYIKSMILMVASVGFVSTAMAQTTWNVSLWGKPRYFTNHVEKLAEVLNEKTNGDFTLKLFYGQALSKTRENLDGISFDAFEMAQTCLVYHPGKTPISSSLTSLPYLFPNDDIREIGAIFSKAHQLPIVKKELEEWNAKILMPSPLTLYNLVGKGTPPKTVADLAGLRIRVAGKMADLMRELDAKPTVIPITEAYTSMNTGGFDAAGFSPITAMAYKLTELADYKTLNLNLGTADCPVIMNINAYNALSDSNRQALESSVPAVMDYYYEMFDKETDKFVEATKGVVAITYSDADRAKIQNAANVIWDAWKSDMKAKGIDGQELLDAILK